jgi:hypothetical protein
MRISLCLYKLKKVNIRRIPSLYQLYTVLATFSMLLIELYICLDQGTS